MDFWLKCSTFLFYEWHDPLRKGNNTSSDLLLRRLTNDKTRHALNPRGVCFSSCRLFVHFFHAVKFYFRRRKNAIVTQFSQKKNNKRRNSQQVWLEREIHFLFAKDIRRSGFLCCAMFFLHDMLGGWCGGTLAGWAWFFIDFLIVNCKACRQAAVVVLSPAIMWNS